MVVSQEVANQRYQEYLAQKAIRDQENQQLDAQRQAHIIEAKTRLEAARLNEIHRCSKKEGYICECCGKLIPFGTKYRRQNIPVGYGFMEGTHFTQRITHLICNTEAKQ